MTAKCLIARPWAKNNGITKVLAQLLSGETSRAGRLLVIQGVEFVPVRVPHIS